MDLIAQLEQIKADYASALALVEENKASFESFNSQLAAKALELEAKDKALNEALSLVADKDISLASIKAELDELKALHKSAEDKALEIVASQGVPPIKFAPNASEAMSREDAGARYAELLGTDTVAAGRFFAQNAQLFA